MDSNKASSSNFVDQIQMRVPVVWVTTDEPARAIEKIASESERDVFIQDAVDALKKYNADTNSWEVVLHESGRKLHEEPDMKEFLDSQDNPIVCIMGFNPMMSGMFHSQLIQHHEVVRNDNAEDLDIQYVVFTHEDEVDPAFKRVVTHVKHDIPSREELLDVIDAFKPQVTIDTSEERLAEAGVGLSETEFLNATLTSARQNDGQIDTEFVMRRKREILKDSDILDVRRPELTVADLGGLDQAKALITKIKRTWDNEEELRHLNLTPIRRIMMVGVPGVGKSLLCEAIATTLGVDLGKGGISASMNKFVGESESNMRKTFTTLRKLAPIVFWIDEFGRDLAGGGSSGYTDGGTTNRVHGEFLTGLQELPHNVFLAAAANRIDALPPEMLRADRFDRIMFAGFPTLNERMDIFKIHLGEDYENFNLEQLAEVTSYFTGAEIKSLVNEVAFEVGTEELRRPTTEEIVKQAPEMKNRVWINKNDDIVAMYKRAATEWYWASSEQRKEASKVLRDAGYGGNIPSYGKPSKNAPAMRFGSKK